MQQLTPNSTYPGGGKMYLDLARHPSGMFLVSTLTEQGREELFQHTDGQAGRQNTWEYGLFPFFHRGSIQRVAVLFSVSPHSAEGGLPVPLPSSPRHVAHPPAPLGPRHSLTHSLTHRFTHSITQSLT
ncbi:hypothetical protein LZ30DRAFT_734313 [Colletotrichum cereale]|nr:hypothetical protein LZ30DRAFT_734313 [Colletotrichum cereale]